MFQQTCERGFCGWPGRCPGEGAALPDHPQAFVSYWILAGSYRGGPGWPGRFPNLGFLEAIISLLFSKPSKISPMYEIGLDTLDTQKSRFAIKGLQVSRQVSRQGGRAGTSWTPGPADVSTFSQVENRQPDLERSQFTVRGRKPAVGQPSSPALPFGISPPPDLRPR